MKFDKHLYLLERTIYNLRSSKFIKNIILLLGSETNKKSYKDLDVDKIIERPKILSSPI